MRLARSVVVLMVVLGSLVVGVGAAGAHVFRADSDVTISYNEAKDRFQGRVASERPSCVRDRTVVVFRETPGEDAVVGADQTNDRGRWTVERSNPQGDFYARVVRRVGGSGDHKHVCRGATSETISLGNDVPDQPGNAP